MDELSSTLLWYQEERERAATEAWKAYCQGQIDGVKYSLRALAAR